MLRSLQNALLSLVVGTCAAFLLLPPGGSPASAETAVPAFVPPGALDYLSGLLTAMIATVLLVELARYAIKPLRKVAGQPVSEGVRIATVLLALAAGQALAFGHVAPAASPGTVGIATAGFLASASAVLFETLIFSYIKRYVAAKFGGTAADADVAP